MPNEDPKLSRYLKRKLNLKEAQEEVEHMVKEKVPCLQKVNQACVDEIGNIRQSEQPHHAEPATCSSTSNFNEDEDLNNIAELKSKTSSQNSVAEGYDSDEEYNLGENDSSNAFEDKDCEPSLYLSMLCLAYKLKYHLSNEAFKNHLKIIQIATKSTTAEIESAAKCYAKYDHLLMDVKKIFVCAKKNCDAILEIGKNGLPTQKQRCRHPFDKSRSCYILVLPIEKQLKFFLESGGIKLRKETTAGYDGTTLGDVQSGNSYREKVHGDGSEKKVIFTLQLNVDGAQCFKKSKFGFWPFMGVINEIAYGARRGNMILMSLWFGNKKPPRGPFLDTSIAELKHLGSSGMKFGELTVFLKPLVLTTDSMARTVFLDGTICRGEFGCDFCLHPGETTKIGRGSARVYPEPVTNPTFQLRTIEQHEKDLMIVLEKGKPVHGIKGYSPFLALTSFDYVTAQVPDYLHSVCQGAIKCLLEFWTESQYHKEPWYLDKDQRAILDARLSQMRPPYEVTRTSALVSNLGDWKASEYRAFALYYFSAVEDLLPKQFYDHFLCLVYGLQVLLQEEVPIERVKEVEFIFQYFVREAELLYGRQRIRYNFHLLTHLVQSALNWGLPWSYSTFIPEWFNGELISLKNGTQSVAEQMVRSFLLKKAVRSDAINLITNFNLPVTVSALLRKLLNISQKEAFYSHINEDYCGINNDTSQLLGSAKKKTTNPFHEIAIRNYLDSSDTDGSLRKSIKCFTYHYSYKRVKVPRKGIFTTTSYTRSPKRTNYCAYMKEDYFFMIESIISFQSLPLEGNIILVGRVMGTISNVKYLPSIDNVSFSNFHGQSRKLIGLSTELTAFRPNDIIKKCVIGFNNELTETFVVTPLVNSLESD